MTQDGQFELTDFLSKKIESKTVMDLTNYINSQGKAQYMQIGEVISTTYEREKDSEELLARLTNDKNFYERAKSEMIVLPENNQMSIEDFI